MHVITLKVSSVHVVDEDGVVDRHIIGISRPVVGGLNVVDVRN